MFYCNKTEVFVNHTCLVKRSKKGSKIGLKSVLLGPGGAQDPLWDSFCGQFLFPLAIFPPWGRPGAHQGLTKQRRERNTEKPQKRNTRRYPSVPPRTRRYPLGYPLPPHPPTPAEPPRHCTPEQSLCNSSSRVSAIGLCRVSAIALCRVSAQAIVLCSTHMCSHARSADLSEKIRNA